VGSMNAKPKMVTISEPTKAVGLTIKTSMKSIYRDVPTSEFEFVGYEFE